ncbi:MAG TPA: hypothetical protein VLT36_23120 [Candidatus Dormibacteraeota bacterium]|nr:hypothetical protein [Candidatus Dormibacteraeota bacterium]
MRKRLPILSVWVLAYAVLVVVGARYGLQRLVLPTLVLLFAPPFFFCMRATRHVVSRVRSAFPEQWTVLNRGMELRLFFFDERTFGDETIAGWKQELRWWIRAGITGIVLFLPTLLLIERISK